MKKPYKLILASSFLLALLMGILLNSTTTPWGGIWYISALLFVFFSFTYSLMYYVTRNRNPYLYILVAAVGITAILFFMEYMFWDNDPPNPSASQIVFESVVMGSMYTALIWGVLSGLYFLVSKALGLISGTISKQ